MKKLTLNSKTVFFIMSGGMALLIVAAVGLVVMGNSILSKKTDKLTELKLENRVLDEQKTAVAKAQKDLEKYAELERIAIQIVPQDKDQAKTVREIVKIADESQIAISSITFPSSTLGQAQTVAPKAEGSGEAAAKPATPPVTQVKPVDGIPGVFQQEITIQSGTDAATFPKLIAFLSRLESNRRTSQVGTINITPNSTNRSILSFSMVINVYIKP